MSLNYIKSGMTTFDIELQPAAAHSLRSHVCRPISVFVHAHVAAENDKNFFAAKAAKLCEAFYAFKNTPTAKSVCFLFTVALKGHTT